MKKKHLAGARLLSDSVEMSTRPVVYMEADRPLLETTWALSSAHRELVALHHAWPAWPAAGLAGWTETWGV